MEQADASQRDQCIPKLFNWTPRKDFVSPEVKLKIQKYTTEVHETESHHCEAQLDLCMSKTCLPMWSGVRVKQSYLVLFNWFEKWMIFRFFSPAAAVQNAVQAAALVPLVPERVQAVVGSCVVIPCTFIPPDAILGLWRSRVEVQMIFKSRIFYPLRSTAFNSENKGQVSEQFQDRVSLFGQTSGGDCSLRLEDIHLDDAQKFEISLKRTQDRFWGKARKFTLEVLGESGAFGSSQIKAAARGCLKAESFTNK